MKKIKGLNKHLMLYAHCVPVRGKEKAALYNFQLGKVSFIPNSMVDVLEYMTSHTIRETLEFVDSKEFFQEYYDFLIGQDFAFITDKPQQFPRLNLEFHSPELITIAVLEYSLGGYDIKSVFADLNQLMCKHIEIRIADATCQIRQLKEIIAAANNTTIRSIDLYIPNYPGLIEGDLLQLIKTFKKINFISIYQSPKTKRSESEFINYIKSSFQELTRSHFPEDVYIVSTSFFTETHHYNGYFNKRVCIDLNGNIKNCLLQEKSFGNVKDPGKLAAIHNDKDFTWLWKISPDMIEDVKEKATRYCTLYTRNIIDKAGKYYLEE